ncbi:unnamed protein product, partial [Allacma fusca]
TETPNQVNLERICKELALASLEIRFYNHTYAQTNYVVKMVWLFLSISGLFAGIRHWHVSLGMSASLLFIGINGIVLFNLFMGHSYKVPVKVQQLKRRILANTSTLPRHQRNYLQQVVKQIPACEIRAGRFYTLDRSTSPDFTHFVVTQVCSLLIAF